MFCIEYFVVHRCRKGPSKVNIIVHLGILKASLVFIQSVVLVYVNCLRRLFTYHCQNLVFTGALYANVCFCVISKQTMGYYANGV